jgi:uncharacterized protein YggE
MVARSLAAAIAGTLILAAPVCAQTLEQELPRRLMTVAGHGEVKGKPDMAVVTVGVLRQAKTAREALNASNEAMNAVLAALKGQGIAEKDLQTANFSVSPRYDHEKNENPPRLVGYEVSNQLTVTVRELGKLGAILDEAVSEGSNQIHGVAFAIGKPEPLRDEARRLAVGDAERKAKLYAEAAKVTLVAIARISEEGGVRPPEPYPRAMRMSAEAAGQVPIAQGEQTVEMQVSITWEIR